MSREVSNFESHGAVVNIIQKTINYYRYKIRVNEGKRLKGSLEKKINSYLGPSLGGGAH